jgi:hypothetical protein
MVKTSSIAKLLTGLLLAMVLFNQWAGSSPQPALAQQDMPEPRNNLVVLWNEVMLAAIRNGAPRPTVVARSLYLVHAAMYDAWALYDPVARPIVLDASLRRPPFEQTSANKAAAVSQAAYHALVHFFPAYEKNTHAFSYLLKNLGYQVENTPDPTTPSGIGLIAARTLIAHRQNDGSNEANNYADVTSTIYPELYRPLNSPDPTAPNGLGQPDFDPNHWHPVRVPTGLFYGPDGLVGVDDTDPNSYREQAYLTPHWGAVKPFALTSGDQFRPPVPPQAGSSEPYTDTLGQTMTNDEAYHAQFDQVLHFSATLTDEMMCIADYWADGPRSETPPGHWNALAHGISQRDRHTIDEDIKLYLALNGALFDASIAAWDAKRAYDFIRPISAIRHKYQGQMIDAWGGPNQGIIQIPGNQWRPYQDLGFVTPPFAEYVSGHSTFSAAAAEVLTQYTGSEQFYDGVTMLDEDFNRDGVPDMLGQHVIRVQGNMFADAPAEVVVLQWETFKEAADEAGLSRLYGGIHIQDSDRQGRAMGQQIGAQAFALAQQYWTGSVNN